MYKTVVVLPDGTELSSGSTGSHAIVSCTLTQSANEDTQLNPGSVCSDAIELTILTDGEELGVDAGAELQVYWEDKSGQRQAVGIFITEKPSRISANRLKILGYDRVSLLDRDMTDWLEGLTQWPYDLEIFAQMVCQACGLDLHIDHLLNSGFQVQKLSADGITGRQLMRWVCQAGCAFCRADSKGTLYTGWYVDRESVLEPGGSRFYYQNSLSYENFQTEPVSQVCLRNAVEDVGACYPESDGGGNPYSITGNPLLVSEDTQKLQSVAQNIYETLKETVYTPCKVTIPIDSKIVVGERFCVTDASGRTITALSMSVRISGQKMTVECVGDIRRSTVSSKNSLSQYALSGKVMKLQTTVDGLQIENRDAAGKIAELEVTVDGIYSTVELHERTINERLDPDLTQTVNWVSRLQQEADNIALQVNSVEQTANRAADDSWYALTQASDLSITVDSIALQVNSVEQTADRAATDSWYALTQTSELMLTADSITAEVNRQSDSVEGLSQELTRVKQTAQTLEVSVQSIQENGTSKVTTSTGYTFGADGLRIQKAGQEMENLLDEKGMTVSRGDTVMLKADKDGVLATDVTVRNYLIVGTHARFEDHGDGRTACFYL